MRWLPVAGLRIGHSADLRARSGVSVLLFDRASPTVISAPGGASCTYDTASLGLEATFGRRYALFFAGGSIFGLDAGRGVRDALAQRGVGHRVFGNARRVIPISGATLFDLPSAPKRLPRYDRLGARAVRAASHRMGQDGAVGAGVGARVGKYLGRTRSMPGGIGLAAARLGPAHGMVCVAALNSIGAVRDPVTSRWLAGAKDDRGGVHPPPDARGAAIPPPLRRERGTSLVAVVTDEPLGRPALVRVLHGAQAGLARSIWPVFTALDGDVLFATPTREAAGSRRERYPGATSDRLASVAARLVGQACRRAVSANDRSV